MPEIKSQLELSIDEEAVDYAREEGGVLTIRPSPRHGCCGGRVELAVASTESPADLEAYVETERQGLTVYVHRGFVSLNNAPLHVGLDRLWLWSALYVEAASQM
ncbi:CC/Se motif family (seleno)protein [Salinibacter altiplanensis]|uniref:CC/Se motif family (seleno)protein n=1 Tax=Salinibacter altiplanensis TaxID=1803181 RepID=UPI000C9FD10A|nr:CC/Se motif family (seleno)protein [Salinibacter altiplanensis]